MANPKDVYSTYMLAYARHEAEPYGDFRLTLASSLGCIHAGRDDVFLMPSELAEVLRDMGAEQPDDGEALRRELEHEKEEREHAQRLLFERCDRDREVRAILEASPDETTATAARRVMAGECDVGPSDRDRRIEAEAHARLSKLILAGGKVETGGRSLYESAGDEIVRLRGELERMHAERDEVRGILDPRRDPGTVASKARHVVEDLARERELYLSMCREKDAERARAGKAETALFTAREEAKAAREQGAAEMRERAAAYLDAHAAEDELDGRKREAEGLREIARRVRDIPLSGGPDYGAKVGQAAAGGRAASRLEPDVPALTEEDRYTLRGDEWEEQDDGRWFKTFVRGCDPMDHGLFDPRTPGGLRALRERARRIRAKVPPAPHGVTGEASGGDRAAGGEGSVAEAQGEKQGAADETPLQRAVGLLHRAMWHRTAEFLRNGELTPRKALERIRGFISDVPADVDDAAAMAALEALIASSEAPALRRVGCGAGRGHADSPHACAPVALPKPERVEVGQRWRFEVPIVDPVDLVVEGVQRGDSETRVSVRSASGRIWFDLQQDWLLNGGAWTFLGPAPQGPSPKRDEAEPAGCNDILEGRPTTATDEHTDGPTARDAVAGMLLRQGYPGSAEDLAKGKVSAKDLAAEFRDDSLALQESPACIAALDALDRGDLCGARDHVGLAAVISRVAGERDELRRERDEARAEAAALREERDELKSDLERWTGRAADLEKQRDEACKDALDAMRESRALREDRDRALSIAEDLAAVTKTALRDASPLRPAEDIAREHVEARKEGDTFWFGDNKESIVLSHRFTDMSRGVDCVRRILTRYIERGRAEGKRAPVEAPRAQEAPNGMRIERREDGEYLIDSGKVVNACMEKRGGCVCHYHFNGEHISTSLKHYEDGSERITARWPIAPSQDEPPSQVVAESDRIESADGNIVVEMPKDADPRAVLATVAELLGLSPQDAESALDTTSLDQIRAHAQAFARSQPELAERLWSYARGVEMGERRAQARHAETPTGAPDREALGRAVHEVWREAWTVYGSGSARRTWEECTDEDHEVDRRIGERLFAMGVENGERRAEEKARATARGLVEKWEGTRSRACGAGEVAKANAVLRCMVNIRYAFGVCGAPDPVKPPTGGEPAPDASEVVADRATTHVEAEGKRGQRSETLASVVASGGLFADTDARWQPGAVWEHTGDGGHRMSFVLDRLDSEPCPGVQWAYFRDLSIVAVANMTEENGWRYVGPASEATATLGDRDAAYGPSDGHAQPPPPVKSVPHTGWMGEGSTVDSLAGWVGQPARDLAAAWNRHVEACKGGAPHGGGAGQGVAVEPDERSGPERRIEVSRDALVNLGIGPTRARRCAEIAEEEGIDDPELWHRALVDLVRDVGPDGFSALTTTSAVEAFREMLRYAARAAVKPPHNATPSALGEGVAMHNLLATDPAARAHLGGDQLDAAAQRLAVATGGDVDRIASEARRVMVEPAAPDPRALAEQIVPAAVYVNERAPYFGPALRDDGKPGVQLTSYFGAEDSRDARAKVVEHVAALLSGAAAKSG